MNRLRELREREELTLQDVADRVNEDSDNKTITANSISQYERDERKPKLDTLISLANVFSVTTDYLLGRSEDENGYYKQVFEFLKEPENPFRGDWENVFSILPLMTDNDITKLFKKYFEENPFTTNGFNNNFDRSNDLFDEALKREYELVQNGTRTLSSDTEAADNGLSAKILALSSDDYGLVKQLVDRLSNIESIEKDKDDLQQQVEKLRKKNDNGNEVYKNLRAKYETFKRQQGFVDDDDLPF